MNPFDTLNSSTLCQIQEKQACYLIWWMTWRTRYIQYIQMHIQVPQQNLTHHSIQVLQLCPTPHLGHQLAKLLSTQDNFSGCAAVVVYLFLVQCRPGIRLGLPSSPAVAVSVRQWGATPALIAAHQAANVSTLGRQAQCPAHGPQQGSKCTTGQYILVHLTLLLSILCGH